MQTFVSMPNCWLGIFWHVQPGTFSLRLLLFRTDCAAAAYNGAASVYLCAAVAYLCAAAAYLCAAAAYLCAAAAYLSS